MTGRPSSTRPAAAAEAATGPGPPDATSAPPTHPRPGCVGDVCVTCSDTAVEVIVVRLLGDGLAVVDTGTGGPMEEVSVALVDARPGDRILVHAKEAIAVVGR